MKLRDTFLNRAPAPAEREPLGVMKMALAGIGDRDVRVAQDFLWSMGVAPMPGDGVSGWLPMQGDQVEFVVPGGDGLRRAGRIFELQGHDALVQVNAGEYNLVPLAKLRPISAQYRRQERRAAIQTALEGRGGPHLHETRALIPMGRSDFACTLHHVAGLRPTGEDIDAYIAARYPGARVVDGDDTHPGRIGLVLSFQDPNAGQRALVASQQVFGQLAGPEEPPSSRENATGIGKEEIEGTGKIAVPQESDQEGTMGQGGEDLQPLGGGNAIITTEKKRSWLSRSAAAIQELAARYPLFDITETSIEETGVGFISHYAMTDNGRKLFLKNGELTPVLSEGAAPAIGTVAVSDIGTTVHLAHVLVADYDAGQGPMSIHENEPGANETGSYVVKADGEGHVVPTPPGFGPDGMPVHSDFEQDGKFPGLKEVDFRREKERYDLQQQEQAKAEQRAKQRRLERLKPQSPQPGQTPGTQIYTGSATPPATEEDGEHRETIGGPGLHIAVDEPTKEYYDDYFGAYGKQLTKDVATHVAALVKSAWKEAGRPEPTAGELLWATGILTAPFVWNAAIRTADQFDDLAKTLMQSANVSAVAKQKLQQMISQQLAKADPMMAKRFRANDPSVMQKMLPQILRTMDPKTLDKMTYALAPGEATATQPGWLSKNVFQRGREKTRQQIEQGRQLEDWMGGGGAAPGAEPAAPGAGPGGTGQAPAQGAGAGAGAPAGGGGKQVTIPAGTKIKGPDGQPMALPSDTPATVQNLPTPSEPSMPAGAEPQQAPGAAAPQPPATAAPQPPATAGEAGAQMAPQAPAPPQQQQRAYIEIPRGAQAFDVEGKRVRIAQPTGAHVIQEQPGMKLVRTVDGQVLRLGAPTATASRRTADAATDAYPGRRPPAQNQLRFRMEGLSRRGDYLVAAIVWDTEAAKAMAPASVVAAIKQYVKQRASEKEHIDLGFTGHATIENVDMAMGLAEVRFRSSEARNGPQETVPREDAEYHELA